MLRKSVLALLHVLIPAVISCAPGRTVEKVDPDAGKTLYCGEGQTPLADGCIERPSQCTDSQILVGTACISLPQIKVDTVGYLVDRKKLATVPVDKISATSFAVVNADTNSVSYEGALGEATTNRDTGDTTRIADFTQLNTPGKYVLRVEGLADSPSFVIGADALNEALRVTMLGLYGQRCGVAIDIEHLGNKFHHDACHTTDAIAGATFGEGAGWSGGSKVDGAGGWHDAGDYGKYTVNAAFALAFVLKAWEDFGAGLGAVAHIPGYSGSLPQFLDEAKFQMDQLLKMQLEDGSAAHMIGPAAFPGPTMSPEDDTTVRHFTGIGTGATADLVAISAIAARVYKSVDADYAAKCLAAAERGLAFLDANPTPISPSYKGFTHSAYNRSDDKGERFWAAAEMWRTTGKPELLSVVESSLKSQVAINFDWGNVDNLGMFTYVQADSSARSAEKLEAARQAIVTSADKLVSGTAQHAYGRGIGTMYYWGSNGVLARSAMNLYVANQISPDPKYVDAVVQQVDYLLGRNPFGRSMVTGLGYLPASSPHHRPSDGDTVSAPWPGLLVGGPNNDKNDTIIEELAGVPAGLKWIDDSSDYYVNEVAINWNTALVYALAGLYK